MQELFWRFGGRCYYCDCETEIVSNGCGRIPENAATLDHKVPKVRGGQRTEENSVLACFGCNNKKGDLPADVFVDLQARNAPEHEWRAARQAAARMNGVRHRGVRYRRLKPLGAVTVRQDDGPALKLLATSSPPSIAPGGYFEALKVLKIKELPPCPTRSPSHSTDATTVAVAGAEEKPAASAPTATRMLPSSTGSAVTLASRFYRIVVALVAGALTSRTGRPSRLGWKGRGVSG